MLGFERLAIGYFAALAAVSLCVQARRRAWIAFAASMGAVGVVFWVSRWASDTLRAWAPHSYLLAGYWLPALLVEGAPGQFEHWLRNRDSRWVWARLAVPKRAAHAFELAYLLCYPLVPIAFLTVRNGGNTANLERFWISVLGAGYVCYATLPWLVSRPPRLLAGDIAPAPPIQRLNGNLLARFSHSFITFPSGHVAVSTAAALTALSVSLPAGIVLLVVSCGVAIAAISGGYHYALDVVLGAFVGIVIAVLSSWI